MIKRLRSLAPPGIRIQLTLWYSLVSALLTLFFVITFYTSMQQLLGSSFDTTLQMRAQQVAEGVSLHNGTLVVDDVVNELPELEATAAVIDSSSSNDVVRPTNRAQRDQGGQGKPAAQSMSSNRLIVRVLDRSGRAVYWTSKFNKLAVPAESITQPLSQRLPWRGTIEEANDQPIRLYSTMLMSGKTVIGVVQVGQSLARLEDHLQRILFSLLLMTPLLLVSSAFGSYWLAERAFRPIRRLTHTAREIEAKDLHQRVPVPAARDEVRDLSVIFNQMIERLEHAFMQQRRFVADASHELRTPVAVIRNITEVALSHPSPAEEYVTVLQEVNAESERLGRLINDLLALARADEGQVQLDQDLVRLDQLVADVVASLEPLAAERSIALRTQTLDAATVLGDAARLIQVLMNLVDNALNYTGAGGEVSLSVESCRAHVHVLVRDTGIGIAAKDLEHIFERFYRADPARSKAVGGSGLGLSIVDWLVRAHGGVVTVESTVGQGSTFLVTLPLATKKV